MFEESPNEPTPKPKRPHPLEVPPTPEEIAPRPRGILHIRVVSPYFTYGLVAINSLIYLLVFHLLNPIQTREIYNWGMSNQGLILVEGQYHRLLSAMFLHLGLAHVVFNMYALYIIGMTIERFFGHIRFLLVYFLGGLSGSVLSIILNPANVNSVGASGAVFAIFGAQMVFLYKHRKLFGEMGKQQLRQLIIIAGMNFAIGIISTFNTDGGVVIDNWGHMGGLLGGIAVAWLISPIFLLEKHASKENEFSVVDINPLKNHYDHLIFYISGILAVLIATSLIARGGM